MNHISLTSIPNIKYLESNNFFLLAGPCAIETKEISFATAARLKEICDNLQIPLIFKSSFKKANRSRTDSFTGIGNEEALDILAETGAKYGLPTVTDIHETHDAMLAAKYVDVLQIPAFLCRQTDLILAAAETGKTVNIKKGQFSSPDSMVHAVNKVRTSGSEKVMLTDRGTFFGYQDLVVDFRGLVEMKAFETPVIMDVTHALQQPNQSSGVTGGKPHMIETICRAAIAVGVDGIFMETHPSPATAKSDGANMIALDKVEALLKRLVQLRQTIIKIDTSV